MKKVVSLLLALTMLFAIGTSAMAAEDTTQPAPFDGGTALPRLNGADANGDGLVDIAPRMEWTANADEVSIAKGEIFLVNTETKKIVLPDSQLQPGTEYTFDVYYATDALGTFDIDTVFDPSAPPADTALLTESQITDSTHTTGKLRLRSGKGGSAISDHELKLRGNGPARRYVVDITTKDLYNTKMTDVTYTLVTSGTIVNDDILGQSGISFEVGYDKMSDDEVDSYEEGDTITLTNDEPILTKKQIERIVKNYNWRAVELEFEDGSWRYEGRMSGMGDTNFYTTQDVVPSIMNKFDQDFKFLILPAGVSFPTNGEMRIDVSDVSDDWDRIYTYLYRNGKLTPINTTYDSNDDMIVFRTNYLGAFVMTDVEITDTSLIDGGDESSGPETPAPEPEPEPSAPGTGTGTGNGNGNPNTGIPVGLNLVFGLGAVSLLGAGTVMARRKK